jgi:hypothetical protein
VNLLLFIFKRASRHWQILATLSLGVILATALLASGPVLINTVVEFGLRRTLLARDILQGNLRLEAFTFLPQEDPEAEYAALDTEIQQVVELHLGPYVEQIVPALQSWWMLPWQDEQIVSDQRLSLRVYGADDEETRSRLELVAGDWPETAVLDADGRVVAAVLPVGMADAFGLEVGDRLPLSARPDEEEPAAWLEVAAIARPFDGEDRYWFGEYSPFYVEVDDEWQAQYGVLIPAGQFFATAEQFNPDGRPELNWNVLLDPATISVDDIPHLLAAEGALSAAVRDMNGRPNMQTQIDDVIINFANQANVVRAPLLFLTAEIVLLALFYVVMIASLSVQQVEREFAILASRGMNRWQLFRIQLVEALLIALVAFISGPLIGANLVRGLALVGPLADVGEVTWPLTVDSAAWIAAGVGILACLLGLLVPAGTAVRRSIVSQQRTVGRQTTPPFWQRYYLDVFVLAVGLVLFYRLQVYGGIVGGGEARPRVDWLLLMAPVALLLGSGTILLRLFPPLMRLLARLASLRPGLPGALAMWQVARNPTHVARLVLLLTLAMALGILSTGLAATLDLSESERALYAAGTELRLTSARSLLLDDVAQAIPEEAQVSGLWRNRGSISFGRTFGSVEVLAVDPLVIGDQATFRPDFADDPIPVVLNDLVLEERAEYPVTPLPGRPGAISIWAWTPEDDEDGDRSFACGESDLDRLGLSAKLLTAQGQLITAPLLPEEMGGYPADGWRFFSGSIPALEADSYPLSLHSVWVQNRVRSCGLFQNYRDALINLALDDIVIVDRDSGVETLIDGFEDITRVWQTSTEDSRTIYQPSEEAHSGRARLWIFNFFGPRESIGLSLANIEAENVLPALASPAFLNFTDIQVGDLLDVTMRFGSRVTFQIVNTVNYFPTLYEGENGYLVTAVEPLLDLLNRNTPIAVNVNEVLVSGAGNLGDEAIRREVSRVPNAAAVISAEDIRTTIKADPMALGLRSVTFFGYVITTILSLIGFATYFYMSARRREATHGVLRSIGMSPRQLYSMLATEQVVLILFGLALGTALGLILNRIVLPGLPITLGEQTPIPPFLPQNDWWAVGRIYLLLMLAFLVTLGLATWLLYRARLHRVLRIGEE